MKATLTLFIVMLIGLSAEAQTRKSRLQPGRVYSAGEILYAPRLGFTAQVPDGWAGVLPQGTEVFMLVSTTAENTEMYLFAREQGELAAMAEAWKKGVDLSENIRLTAANPVISQGILSGEVDVQGRPKDRDTRGFAASRCGGHGYCVTLLASAPAQSIAAVGRTAIEFLQRSTFEAPSLASAYADFDWSKFLAGKLMIAYDVAQGGTKENQVNLCADGTFSARLKKTGWMRQTNDYRGSQSGTWSAEGIGEEGVLRLNFSSKKLSPVELNLRIEDEKVFVDGERYYASQSDRCR
jgi:hypothetical protein